MDARDQQEIKELLQTVRAGYAQEIVVYANCAAVLRKALGRHDWGVVAQLENLLAQMAADMAEAVAATS